MTVMFALSALAVEVKGIVTAATVLVNPEGNLTVDPNKELEQKARDNIPGYAYVTAMKIMKDDHVCFIDFDAVIINIFYRFGGLIWKDFQNHSTFHLL